jgi:hypothetical protein
MGKEQAVRRTFYRDRCWEEDYADGQKHGRWVEKDLAGNVLAERRYDHGTLL